MSLTYFVLLLLIVGVILAVVPIEDTIRRIIIAVVIVGAVTYLVTAFTGGHLRLP